MIAATLEQIAADCGSVSTPAAGVLASGVVTDNRQVGEGDLFAAIRGTKVDANRFAAAALEAGAAGVLTADAEAALASGAAADRIVAVDSVEAALGVLAQANVERIRSKGNRDFRIVAVTGSVGKTTTKDLLARLLVSRGPVIAPPGSFNNEIGLPLTVLRAGETTASLVLEMGADHVGNIEYLTSIAPPDAGAVLAVARAHLGEFGGIENVAKTKAEMLAGLREGAPIVLNADDARVAAMAAQARGPVIRFSRTTRDAEVAATDIVADADGRPSFLLHAQGRSVPVSLALAGIHHVSNALAAAALALALGTDLDEIAGGLAGAEAASPHRMDVRTVREMRIIDDSYNANPDSMRAGISALSLIGADGPKIAVLGAMLELGEECEAEHAALGRVLAEAGVGTLLCMGEGLTSLNRAAANEGIEVLDVADLEETLEALARLGQPGATVLLKGSNGSGVWKVADALFDGDEPEKE